MRFSFGIASTASVFSVVDAVLLRPPSFTRPETMVVIQAAHKNGDWGGVAPEVYEILRSRSGLFSPIAVARKAIFTVTRVPVPDQIFGATVSGNFFSLVVGRPLLGRVLNFQDEKKGAPPVALLSYRAWRQLFGGDAQIVGKTALIDGVVHTVAGVMPAGFVMPGPYSGSMLWTATADLYLPKGRELEVFARRQPSLNLESLQRGLNAIAAHLPASVKEDGAPMRLQASPVRNETEQTERVTLWLAMGMVTGLLLIGCANLSSILLARAIGRRRDFAIRIATGASRTQLIGQGLLEVGLLATVSLAIACGLSSAALQIIRDRLSIAGTGLSNLAQVELNGHTLLFSFGVTLFCALACGLFPAIPATSVDVASGLRQAGTQIDGGRAARRFLHSLLAVQACVSLLLLLTSGLLVRSLSRLMSDDHGIRPDHVLTLRVPTGSWQVVSTKKTPEQQQARIESYLAFLRRAENLPGVQAAALASSLPLSHVVVTTHLYAPGNGQQIGPITQAVTRDYFRVMGIPVLSGQTFDPASAHSKLRVALVNQAFVRQYFHGEDPVGRFLHAPYEEGNMKIIGVVKDTPHLDFAGPVEPEVFSDFEQTSLMPFLTGLVVRTRENPLSLSGVLRNTLSSQDSDQAVVQVKTLQTLVDENIWQPRFSAWLFSTFAFVALCLSGIGIYGVVAYVTASRRRGFGIRAALGAEPGNLLRLATSQSFVPVLVGSSFGLLGFYWTSKWISTLLYKISPFDPVNGIACVCILSVIAAVAVAGPALRAANVDPAIVLRNE